MAVVNLRQAGRLLGFKTAEPLRRMLKRGVLDDYLRPGGDGRCVFLETDPPGLPSLRQQVQANTGFNSASPLWRRELLSDEALDTAMAPINDWIEGREDWSVRANEFLDPAAWTGPPWTPDQWVTLRNVIELAVES
ncbi:hypothetical protein [Synechococcus sp. A15-44]|uniref:hypothetical protein n=1 Tax=Synechococcus sp. A15-44 TaxID=1050646 RepID=UPI001648FC95|nr:hypothetical protein [Synechococcus sp. A15-44]QNI63933.1 hypothetical protein SynA1544_00994 [Synechococcus sp. A15-44]